MDISNITRKISALRSQTAPNSITPEGLGSILQALADLISALSNIDISTETDLVARVEHVEGDVATALGNAQSASTLAANMKIDTFSLGSDNVTITVQQHGYSAMSITLPAATTQKAGVLSAEDKDHLDKAYQRTLYDLSLYSYEDRMQLNYQRHNNQVVNVTFVGATSSSAGLMTAADKVKLDSIETTLGTIQQQQQDILNMTSGFVPTDDGYHVIPIFEGFVVLDSMGTALDNVGNSSGTTIDFTAAKGDCWYNPNTKKIRYWFKDAINPSNFDPSRCKGVFFNKITGRCYRWNGALQEMQEWVTNLM